MFNKKKIKKEVDTSKKFEIPQIVSSYKGIKKSRDVFESSTFSSAIFGTGVKDVSTYHDISSEMGDIRKKYDSFRDKQNKKISENELIERYGTKFPEFHQITLDTAKEVYGEEITLVKIKKSQKAKKENKPTISIIKNASEIINNSENSPKINENIKFNFDFEKQDEDEQNIDQKIDLVNNEYREETTKFFNGHVDDDGQFSNSNTSIIKKNQTIDSLKDITHLNFNNDLDSTNASGLNKKNINDIYETPLNTEGHQNLDSYEGYVFPPITLFSKNMNNSVEVPEWLEEKKQIINETLNSFSISGEVEKTVKGPSFTRYEVALETGVNVRKIVNLKDNFQMNLGVKSIRIQAPIPGKKTIGIEVPNDKRDTVLFGDILTEEFINDGKPLNCVVGKDIDGKIIYTNIAKWPHGLIAGGTGSGKSVCINTIIISILLKAKPDQVKFIMIDPKRVELSIYNDIPHLITPVISDSKLASQALKWAVNEMEKRFNQFADVKARDIESYNLKSLNNPDLKKMSYIVIVIDELADLMMVCGSDVEDSIQRITQKARAAGIHLLCATQRPTVDVVKGTIKANIQARLAFRVNSQTDSLTILDEVGAESLLGKGDLLLKEIDLSKRVQGSFIPDTEIDKAVDFIISESQPDYLFTHEDLNKDENDQKAQSTNNDESKELLLNVAVWCCENQSCSINAIQQNFSLGFNRASRVVQILTDMQIISIPKGNKRKVLMNLNQINDLFENEA